MCRLQHFEGFDPEGFSIWFLDYKYPEENTVNFIVMNKVCPRTQRNQHLTTALLASFDSMSSCRSTGIVFNGGKRCYPSDAAAVWHAES